MIRCAGIVVLCAIALLMTGCSKYHAASKPWAASQVDMEIGAPASASIGDRVRLISVEGDAIEGIYGGVTDHMVLLFDGTKSEPFHSFPVDSIERMELFVGRKPINTTLLSVGAVGLAYVVYLAQSAPVFSPGLDAK